MSELTVKLREWASRGSINGNVQVKAHELLELIGVVEESELRDDEITELETKVTTYRKSSADHQQRISEIRGLPKYMFDKIHGVEQTPVGEYILAEDIDDVVGINRCKCGKPGSSYSHMCPYAAEIHEDTSGCYCCDDCEQECCNNI